MWAGPLEMGHLSHQPGMTGPIGADHYVVVLDVDGERVLVHDPQGYPYASVPAGDFLKAWRAQTVNYGEPYTMRTGFAKVADVADADAIRSIIPSAIERLSMRTERDSATPPTVCCLLVSPPPRTSRRSRHGWWARCSTRWWPVTSGGRPPRSVNWHRPTTSCVPRSWTPARRQPAWPTGRGV